MPSESGGFGKRNLIRNSTGNKCEHHRVHFHKPVCAAYCVLGYMVYTFVVDVVYCWSKCHEAWDCTLILYWAWDFFPQWETWGGQGAWHRGYCHKCLVQKVFFVPVAWSPPFFTWRYQVAQPEEVPSPRQRRNQQGPVGTLVTPEKKSRLK